MIIYKVTGRLRSGALWCHYYDSVDRALRGASMAIRSGDLHVTYTIINEEGADNGEQQTADSAAE